MIALIYAFLNFLQPGVLFASLAPTRPMLIASVIAALAGLKRASGGSIDPRGRFLTHPAFKWLCAFAVVNVISVYYSGVSSMLDQVTKWHVYVLFVAVSLLNIRRPIDLERYVWGMMLGSSVVVGYGLWAVAVHLPTLFEGTAGAYGMYVNHNDYTFIIIMVMPFAYFYLRTCERFLGRVFLLSLLGGCVAGVALSLSRGGMIALVLEVALIVWFSMRGKLRAAVLVTMALVGPVAVIHQFSARAADQGSSYTAKDSELGRFELWKAAIHAYIANPVLGVGSGRFHEFSQDYGEISHDNRGKVAHDTYIEIAADTGTLGLLTFMMMLWSSYRPLRRRPLRDPQRWEALEATRLATLVTLISIMFRATLDTKVNDWSFYVLVVIAIATMTFIEREVAEKGGSASTRITADVRLRAARSAIYCRAEQSDTG